MKYDAKGNWAVALTIEANHSELCCAQVLWCVREIYKAVSFNGNACGVAPHIGGERFHTVDVWADAGCNLALLFQIVAEMCNRGCAVYAIGATREETDALTGLGCALDFVDVLS